MSRTAKILLLFGLPLLLIVAVIVNTRYLRNRPALEHLSKGVDMMNTGKTQEAEKEWRAALRDAPDNPRPYQLLSTLYLNGGQPARAIDLLESLQKIAPRTEHLQCKLAEAYLQTENQKKAMEVARQAVVLEPNCPTAHAVLGMAHGNIQEVPIAISELRKAYQLAPSNDKIALSFVQSLLDGNEASEAETVIRVLIPRMPSSALIHYLFGRALSRRSGDAEKVKEAAKAFEKAIELQPTLAEAYAELGRLRIQMGDNKGAVEVLEFLWKRNTRLPDVAFNLSTAYRNLGNTAMATKMVATFKHMNELSERTEAARKKLSLRPTDVKISLELANLEIENGTLDQAEQLLMGILRLEPQNREALTAAVKLFHVQGRKDLETAYQGRLKSLK